MREILFRGKRLNNGKWVEGCFFRQYGINEIITADDEIYHVTPETVGQYTGLTDQKGKKVFEGDILCIKKRNGTKSRICFVCFGEYIDADSAFDNYRCIGFYIKIFDICCTIGVLWDSEFEYEIIGNIHDNPELLKNNNINT